MALTLRLDKGLPLTHKELDDNFQFLSSSIASGGGTNLTVSGSFAAERVIISGNTSSAAPGGLATSENIRVWVDHGGFAIGGAQGLNGVQGLGLVISETPSNGNHVILSDGSGSNLNLRAAGGDEGDTYVVILADQAGSQESDIFEIAKFGGPLRGAELYHTGSLVFSTAEIGANKGVIVTGTVSASGDVYFPHLTNTTTPHIVGFDTASGQLTFYSTASFGGVTPTDITDLNNFTGSANTRLDDLEAATSSYLTGADTGSFVYSGSFDGNTTLTLYSADTNYTLDLSALAGGSTDITALNNFTGSANTRLDDLEAATSSYLTQVNLSTLHAWTASMNTTSSQLVYNLNWGSDPFSIEWNWWDGSNGGFALNTDLKNIVYTATSSIANINAATSSYLYSGSYNSVASVITLYSANQNYTLDLSGLAGGGGGFPITASDEGVDLTNSMTKINFVGNAVSASNLGSIVTVTINTGSAAGTTDITALNNFTGSAQTNLNALNLATSSYVTNSQTSSFLSNIYNSDGEVTGNREVLAIDKTLLFQMSGSSQFLVSDGPIVGAGQTWTFQVDNQGVYLDGLLSNTPTDYVVAYDSVSTQLSYFSTSSLKTDITALNTFTGSANSRLDSLQAATSSYLLINTPVTASAFSSSYYDFTPMAEGTVPYKNGRLYYNSTEDALTFYNSETDASLQIGQEFWIRAINKSGNDILNGTPVRISGSTGDRANIWPAVAEDHATQPFERHNHIIGLATHDILDNETGFVTTQGIVRGLDTTAFAAGDTLYLQTGSAGFRNDPPPFPYDVVRVGWVTKVNPSNGLIFVEPKSPTHFEDIPIISGSRDAVVGDLMVKQSNGAWTPTHILSGSYQISKGGLTAVSFTGSLKGNVDGTATTASYAPNLYNSNGTISEVRRVTLENDLIFNNTIAKFIVSGSDRVFFRNLGSLNPGHVLTYNTEGGYPDQGIVGYTATSSLSVATASYAPNLYNSNGTLTGDRVVTFGGNDLRFNPGAGEFRVSDGPVGGPLGYEIVMSGSGEFRVNSSVSASFQTNVYVSPSHVLTLAPRHPLPTVSIPLGSFAVSSSTPPRPYMWDGSSWYAL